MYLLGLINAPSGQQFGVLPGFVGQSSRRIRGRILRVRVAITRGDTQERCFSTVLHVVLDSRKGDFFY